MPINDPFATLTPGLTSPATGGFDITPADGADLPMLPRAIMVQSAGNVAVEFADGSSIELPALQPGVIYPIRAQRVLSTGTSATGIKGLY